MTRLRLVLTLMVTYLNRTRNQHLVVDGIQGEVQKGSTRDVQCEYLQDVYLGGQPQHSLKNVMARVRPIK